MGDFPVVGTAPDLFHPRSRGVVADWLFHEGTGSQLGDSFPNQYNGIISGADWINGIEDGNGRIGGALSFDGSNIVTILNPSSFDFDNTIFMVSVWFRTSDTNRQMLVAKTATNDFQWNLEVRADGSFLAQLMNSSAEGVYIAYSDTVLVDDGLLHQGIAIFDTRKPESVVIYIDGINQTNAVADSTGMRTYNSSGVGSVLLGARDDGGPEFLFNGEIGRTIISQGVVPSATEVKEGFSDLYPNYQQPFDLGIFGLEIPARIAAMSQNIGFDPVQSYGIGTN